ncbi:LCP family protein [Mycobacterium sp. TY814]|uniref:LCP family protein n=1 Tax=unclassified Mycobacterium TaxID=2642494 RepID=UPI0027415809|nr:LCP family protein [Mycobacterium sp. TY814]MDP7726420.1 LCP family protein [Mycobacterium sp. TY814]
MSDGEKDATPGHRRAPNAGDPDFLTAIEQPLPGAAPWERFSASPTDDELSKWSAGTPAKAETRADEPESEQTGSHNDGVLSVADLIAKLGATLPDRPTHHHVAEEPEAEEPEADHQPQIDEEPEFAGRDDLLDTQVIPTPAYSLQLLSEIPDLGATNYPEDGGAEKAPRRRRRRTSSPAGDSTDAPPKPRSRRRPILIAGRSMVAVFALLSLVLTGGAWHWSSSKNNQLNTVSALDPGSSDIVDPNAQYGDENFLIVGMDSRLGANANVGAGDTEDAGGARSDTVMLVNIPANRKRVVAVSFPRDLAITPIQCEAWNPEDGKYGPIYDPKTGKTGPRMVYTETKLNSAFSFGGPKCLVKVIQKLSGLSVNRFIAIDFVGFGRMVEALGGVEVCTTTPLKDYELGTVLAHAGRQVIDGPTALNYVRARQVTTESNGDYGRIKRQQLFLSSLLRTMISEDTLMNLNKLNNVVNMFIGNSYVDNVKTKDLVELGRSLQHMAAGHVTFVTVPTGITDQDGNEPPRTADMKALFTAIINDDPLPKENDQNAQSLGSSQTSGTGPSATKKPAQPEAAPAPDMHREQVTTTSPQEVTVQVSNGTGTEGLAAAAASQLKRNGFNVMTPDDYPSSLKTTTVFFSPGNEQAAATVAAAFGNSKVERVTGIGSVVQVVLGPDFSAVSTPPPSGSSVSMQISRNTSSPPTRLPEDLTVTNAADTTCE